MDSIGDAFRIDFYLSSQPGIHARFTGHASETDLLESDFQRIEYRRDLFHAFDSLDTIFLSNVEP